MIYKIADTNIKIEPFYKFTEQKLLPFITDETDFDFEVSFSQEEIIKRSKSTENPCYIDEAEDVLILNYVIKKMLTDFDGFFFHSSCLMLNGEAYAFTAPSGTGKSTHTALWRKHFGDRVTMINDDKPIIRKQNGIFYAYGTPWQGKSNIGNNIKAPVKAVFILQRGKENICKRVKTGEVFKQILQATIVPAEKENIAKLLSLLDEFFSSAELFSLVCNTDEQACITAYNSVFKSSRQLDVNSPTCPTVLKQSHIKVKKSSRQLNINKPNRTAKPTQNER